LKHESRHAGEMAAVDLGADLPPDCVRQFGFASGSIAWSGHGSGSGSHDMLPGQIISGYEKFPPGAPAAPGMRNMV
jgi:hypothetical protein